jgi:UDPglucose 6-dehydrogenase
VKAGWIGLGKVGLACSLALHVRGGHEIYGYDVSGKPQRILQGKEPVPRGEKDLQDLLELADLTTYQVLKSSEDVVRNSDIVVIAVQTPHALQYGGKIPAPDNRKDFEYAFLAQAVREVCQAAKEQQKCISIVILSTVLPGTINRLLRPLSNAYTTLIYSPALIALGTTINDYCDPEFVICGVDKDADADILRELFWPLHGDDRLHVTSIETAELTKIAYNTFLVMKVVFGNMIMEVSHKTGADCDQVIDALGKGSDRIMTTKFMRGGMGSSGPCHPRDIIAMSWLSQHLDLSYDLLGETVKAREAQARWIADLARHYSDVAHLPIIMLGKGYKPRSHLTYGSVSYLLKYYLGDDLTYFYDPYVDRSPIGEPEAIQIKPAVVIIATKHPEFAEYSYQPGTIVLDPFGYVPDRPGCTIIRIGRK